MSNKLSQLRPAMTAIAAVMALSSTPLLAQTADSTAGQAAPVVIAPPAPVETAAPAVAQTAAPEVATPVATPVEAAAPAPAMKTIGTPVVHDADTTAADAAPVASSKRTAAPVPVKRSVPVTASVAKAAPAAVAASTPAIEPTVATPAPKVAAPVSDNLAKTAPAAAPAPVVTAKQTTHATSIDDEALPIAGGVGLAVIALGGAAAYAMRRRRREREEELLLEPAPVEAVAVPETAPVVSASTVMAPAFAAAAPKTLPNGFDLSRFGRHTQAAYVGPTADNPSYSLRKRLKRASFFDQREREALEAGKPVEQAPIAAPVQQAAAAKQDDGQITVRLSPQRKSGGFGYVLQR